MGVTTTLPQVEHSGKDKRLPDPCIVVVFGALLSLKFRAKCASFKSS